MTIAAKMREAEYAKRLLELENLVADLVQRIASLEKARPVLKLNPKDRHEDGRQPTDNGNRTV
jgi:hypothetical protein